MNFEESTNSFETKKKNGLPYHLSDNWFLTNLLITFWIIIMQNKSSCHF